VAQGLEAGGHRGAFDADAAERQMAGLLLSYRASLMWCLSQSSPPP
jgi:hypothetical protein